MIALSLDWPFAAISEMVEYITEDSKRELMKRADEVIGNPWELTIGQFFDLTNGDASCKGINVDDPASITIMQYYWLERFRAFVDELSSALRSLSIPPTPEAMQAAKVCVQVSFEESILVFCREYFGLKSFDEVYSITLADLLIAKRDTYNRAAYERAMAAIYQSKHKKQ